MARDPEASRVALHGRLSKARDALRASSLRVSMPVLGVLLITSIAYYRALGRIDAGEARPIVDQLLAISTQQSPPQFSYVFGNLFADGIARLPKDRPVDAEEKQQLEDALQKLASSWYTVSFSLFGTEIPIDLRILLPILPMLLFPAAAYLYILRIKEEVIERHLVEVESVSTSPEVQWHTAAYRKYPDSMVTKVYWGALLMSSAFLAYLLLPFFQSLTTSTRSESLKGLGVYAILLGAYCHRARVSLLGRSGPRSWRLVQWIEHRRVWAAVRRFRFGGVSSVAGSMLVLLSLSQMTAVGCDHGTGRSGYQLLTNDDNATWFTNWQGGLPVGNDVLDTTGWVTGLLVTALGRSFYGADLGLSLLILCTAAVYATRRLRLERSRSSRRWRWPIKIARSVSGALMLLMVISVSCYVQTPDGAFGSSCTLLLWPMFFTWWIAHVWRSDTEAWLRRRRRMAAVLVPPAIIFGLSCVWWIYRARMWGVALLAVGTVLQCLGLGGVWANVTAPSEIGRASREPDIEIEMIGVVVNP